MVFSQIITFASTFTTIFLGIFIEALPYLILGTLASGIVEVFVKREALFMRLPKNRFFGVLMGALLGLIFPVCECGVVPLTRRLYTKGLPPAIGIAFLLAAPVLNPIVILSTYTAFGFGVIFWGRMVISLVVAVITGLIFSMLPESELLIPINEVPVCSTHTHSGSEKQSFKEKILQSASIAIEELFEMGKYLILGGLLAALMQTLLPQNTLLAMGTGPFISILLLVALAVLLSICSTVDAFVALSFAASFSTGSILAFLIYGPMVDIKSIFLFTRVFKKKTVAYLAIIPLFLVVLITLFINYRLGI